MLKSSERDEFKSIFVGDCNILNIVQKFIARSSMIQISNQTWRNSLFCGSTPSLHPPMIPIEYLPMILLIQQKIIDIHLIFANHCPVKRISFVFCDGDLYYLHRNKRNCSWVLIVSYNVTKSTFQLAWLHKCTWKDHASQQVHNTIFLTIWFARNKRYIIPPCWWVIFRA